jgi:arginase family enzyme
VIWIDAHADLNTPGSSKSGNVTACHCARTGRRQ